MNSSVRWVVSALAVAHLVVSAWHGSAHESLGVALPPAKMAFVYAVVLLAPTLAALVIWTRYARTALLVFLVSMVGSFLFGVYHHYIAVSSDHIHHLPLADSVARAAFIGSAAVLAVLELVSSLYAAVCVRTVMRAKEADRE
jgi:hypothetical protein